MKIVFKNFDTDDELGCEEYSDILETLVPAFQQGAHDVFLMKKFSSRAGISSWRIKNIATSPQFVEIILAEAEQPISVTAHAKSQTKPPGSYLLRFRIVEVDFGFHSNAFSPCGQLTKNEAITSALLPGELHKKRPCIVLGANKNRAQVIPMTTNLTAGKNPKNIQISHKSFKNMSNHYSQKPSYALLEMIQTVSVNRIFPPRASDGKYHPYYHNYNLCSDDRAALRDILAAQYNQEVVNEKSILQSKVEGLNHEKGMLLNAQRKIKADLDIVQKEKEQLEDLILQIGCHLDLGCSVSEIKQNLERQFN